MAGRVLSLVILIWCFSAAAGGASTWRCGEEIAKVGDSSAEVLMKCGKPTMREEAATIKKGSWRERVREREGSDEGSLSRRGTYGETRVRVENWYYDRGMHDFIYKLTFIGGVLTNIRPLRYGGLMKYQEETAPAPPPPRPKNELHERSEGKGRIDIVGTPAGAKVYLDEFYVGTLPVTIDEVDPGGYGISVRQEGFEEWKERVNVRPEATLWLTVNMKRDSSGQDRPASEEEAPSSKKLYKWTDGQGRIHITDSPPPGNARR